MNTKRNATRDLFGILGIFSLIEKFVLANLNVSYYNRAQSPEPRAQSPEL